MSSFENEELVFNDVLLRSRLLLSLSSSPSPNQSPPPPPLGFKPIDGGVSSIFCESVTFVAFVLISPLSSDCILLDALPDGGFAPLFVSPPSPLCCRLLSRSLGAVEGRSWPKRSSSSPSSSENLTVRLEELGAVSGRARPPRLCDGPLEAADGM